MAQAGLRHLLLGVAAGGLLAGCVTSTDGDTAAGGPVAAATSAPRGMGREVEAPEVFQTTDSALWDGRPSLGGIWVASPDAVDPERVVMFNPATGKSVTGALFRRERDNPGPTLQVSSDAAEALGMIAGQPTELRVTALRREEPEPEVVEAPPPEAAAEAAPTTEPPAATSDVEAIAAAALDGPGEAAGDTAGAAVTGTEAAADPAPASGEPPARKTWKERREEAKAKREAEKAAAEAAAAGADAVEAPGVAPVDPAASAVAEVETAPLDARADEAAAPVAETPSAAPGPARTIQIASFSKEENAKRAIEALAKINITAEVQKADRNGTPFWGVVAVGDAALLTEIRKAGFADAYFLQ
jgi:hypothetical protein